ncbi:hypothetical protein C5Z26_03420 [Lactobacillus sp. CBA3606]|uniref:MFS transporter n=1 Tax=Lactobacillus sp. CBA3606 TaxID=2099789 RepID=UPI000CFC723C|nr:MFS transporter [Lactobacillus sp. CBA3606]AVK63232.1 hypothetical protein C5Z26_03420 [Lactobacillus sp. CBA3606]
MTISVFQSAISVLLNFAQLLFSAKHFSAFQTAIILTIALAFSAVASVSIEKISAKIGNRRAIFLFLSVTIAMFVSLKSNTAAVIVLGFLLIQFSFEFVDTSLNAVVQDLANDKIRTSLISSVNTLTAGLMFFETMLTSALFSVFGVENSFILFGIVVASVTLLLYSAFLVTQKRTN